jgi:hypothetical protein
MKMTRQKANEKDDLIDEYNNRRRWIGNDFEGNKSLQSAFPRYADRSWSITAIKKKIKDMNFFRKVP